MPDGISPRRLTRLPRAHLLAAATLAGGVLLAGCVGGPRSPNQSMTPAAGATTSASSPARTRAARTGAPAAGRGGSQSSAAGPLASGSDPGLAFAKCMRANGVSDFPDPTGGHGEEFPIPAGTSPDAPAFRTAQSRCQKLLGGVLGPGASTHPSAQTLAKLLKIARCMRAHGVPRFPDPTTTIPPNPLAAGIRVITDFDGAILLFPSTINLQAPAYRQALSHCGAPPLGLPH